VARNAASPEEGRNERQTACQRDDRGGEPDLGRNQVTAGHRLENLTGVVEPDRLYRDSFIAEEINLADIP
jgi:hypothetical protein